MHCQIGFCLTTLIIILLFLAWYVSKVRRNHAFTQLMALLTEFHCYTARFPADFEFSKRHISILSLLSLTTALWFVLFSFSWVFTAIYVTFSLFLNYFVHIIIVSKFLFAVPSRNSLNRLLSY